MVRAEDKNNEIMQRRIAERQEEDPHRHELPPGQEATSLDMSDAPTADRTVGHTRWTREPHKGEIIGNKTPPFEVVGLDALSPVLTHIDFPATRDEIIEQIGTVQIPINKQRTKTVREILGEVTPMSFDSRSAVEASIKQRWKEIADVEGRGSRHRQNDTREGGDPTQF